MGIEIPEALGGARRQLLPRRARRRGAVARRPSVGVLVDVQNTLVVNALLRWGNDGHQAGATCPRLAATTVGAYALSEAGSGSDAFALATRATDATATTGR